MMVALDWWQRLATDNRRAKKPAPWEMVYEQKLIAVRASAPGGEWLSFVQLAQWFGRSETVIAGHYNGAVNEVWRNANVPREVLEPAPDTTRVDPETGQRARGLVLSKDVRKALKA